VSPVLRDGDTVVTIPRLVILNRPGESTYEEVVRESESTRRANLAEARALAERWAKVAPNDRRPHEYLGTALLGLGEYAAAAAELEQAATLGTPESRRAIFWDRIEALIKADRGADARRVLDEAAEDPGRDTSLVRNYAVAALNALVGRDRPPPVDSARLRQQRARFEPVLRDRPPAPARPEPGFRELLAAGDTAGARRWLARVDSMLALRAGVMRIPRVGPERIELAEHHLAVGDTAAAEARLAEIERLFAEGPFRYRVGATYGREPWLGRAWLLSGDLAAARGRSEAAARMYRRVVGLWGGGDAKLQSVVEQARARLRSLPAP
jgi:tetratricopeptide (TPR) repeat protein